MSQNNTSSNQEYPLEASENQYFDNRPNYKGYKVNQKPRAQKEIAFSAELPKLIQVTNDFAAFADGTFFLQVVGNGNVPTVQINDNGAANLNNGQALALGNLAEFSFHLAEGDTVKVNLSNVTCVRARWFLRDE